MNSQSGTGGDFASILARRQRMLDRDLPPPGMSLDAASARALATTDEKKITLTDCDLRGGAPGAQDGAST
jgi:hypothetical protein